MKTPLIIDECIEVSKKRALRPEFVGKLKTGLAKLGFEARTLEESGLRFGLKDRPIRGVLEGVEGRILTFDRGARGKMRLNPDDVGFGRLAIAIKGKAAGSKMTAEEMLRIVESMVR